MSEKPVIIIGAGLAGLVAAYELSRRKVPTIILEQENEKNLGGQAFWSLGGIFCVDSKQQKRTGIKDSRELAMADWFNSAQFDREREDYWPRKWAKAFVDFATDEMQSYVGGLGLGFMPSVGWAEKGDGRAGGHGNSVPRFHITWGIGPEVVRIFAEPVKAATAKGIITFKFRHQVDELIVEEKTGRAIGVRGKVLEPDDAARGVSSSRKSIGSFDFVGSAVIVTSGGIGGDIAKVKKNWPVDRLGPKIPENVIVGVPAHVDGKMQEIAQAAGANVVNNDRMWHYTEGLANWNPIWPDHGIRVLAGPTSLWLDATGKRLPAPYFPGTDTLGTLRHICSTGYDYTWFILDRTTISREFSLSGSEQNPDLAGKSVLGVLSRLWKTGGTGPVQDFMKHGQDFVIRDNLKSLVDGMNELSRASGGPDLDYGAISKTVDELNLQLRNDYTKDAQVMLVKNTRNYRPERWGRTAKPHRLTDPAHGPMIAVRLHILTRKSLGGLETDLEANVIKPDGTRFPGLYAAGECAGFGGGGVHGYNSLEGTFLGGCIFSGRAAGRAVAEAYTSGKDLAQSKL